MDDVLFRRYLELNRLFIIDSPAIWTCALLVRVLEAVEAELANLIATRTWLKVLVCKIKFFDAEGTGQAP